jgi:hypothetical protein
MPPPFPSSPVPALPSTQGNVVLTDLVLRASALDELQLPVAVKWGKLGSLQLTVSWKHLLTKPISVKVDEVSQVYTRHVHAAHAHAHTRARTHKLSRRRCYLERSP